MARQGKLAPLKELEAQYGPPAVPVTAVVLGQLRRDPREGAQKLYRKLKRRLECRKQEQDRLQGMLHFEHLLWQAGIERVAGVDEVGIGPMAGPVVAAAVVFPPGTSIEGVDDSKRLSPEKRESLDVQIRAAATGVGLGVVEPDEVDRLNVYRAGIRAMQSAVDSLTELPQHVLVDSRTIPDLPVPQNSFRKGDGLNFSIACASIVAKVSRDRLMLELDRRYPGYGFASHKGYCSQAHQQAVRKLGPSPIHRRSFDFIRELEGEYEALFYTLKSQLEATETRTELNDWEGALRRVRARLPAKEARKLRLLAARRWKRISQS